MLNNTENVRLDKYWTGNNAKLLSLDLKRKTQFVLKRNSWKHQCAIWDCVELSCDSDVQKSNIYSSGKNGDVRLAELECLSQLDAEDEANSTLEWEIDKQKFVPQIFVHGQPITTCYSQYKDFFFVRKKRVKVTWISAM